MKKHTKYFLLSLTLGVFVSCKSVRVLPNKAPVKRVDLKVLSSEISKAEESIRTFRARIRVKYNDQKRQQQLAVNFRLEKDKTFWMSANMLIPIAKLLVTPEEVKFYEKFQKTYYEGDIAFINEQLGTAFSFADLQNIFLGNPITDFKKTKFDRISHPQYYVLSPKVKGGRFRPTYFFDPSNFRLIEQRFLVAGTVQTLSIKYPQLQRVDGKLVPKQIEISTFNGTDFIQLTLDFLRVDFPKNVTVPFTIPAGYKKIDL
ncbi:MAG: DUF4292 domain-containing protein [Flavobacteriaceae bacterium]